MEWYEKEEGAIQWYRVEDGTNTVTFNSNGEERDGSYGPVIHFKVTVNGQDMQWDVSSTVIRRFVAKRLRDAGNLEGHGISFEKSSDKRGRTRYQNVRWLDDWPSPPAP